VSLRLEFQELFLEGGGFGVVNAKFTVNSRSGAGTRRAICILIFHAEVGEGVNMERHPRIVAIKPEYP
jgi:hypothetical protein